MGEIAQLAVTAFKWGLRIHFAVMVISLLLLILSYIFFAFKTAYNVTVLAEIMALIQIWLPFNLGVVIAWITSVAGAIVAYRVNMWGYTWITSIVGK